MLQSQYIAILLHLIDISVTCSHLILRIGNTSPSICSIISQGIFIFIHSLAGFGQIDNSQPTSSVFETGVVNDSPDGNGLHWKKGILCMLPLSL